MRTAVINTFAACLGLLGAACPAQAADTRAVIELFTSQGCSSCPPADRLLGELAKEPGTIALSFPVDYWDYIGWKDTLASPAFTARQKSYASARGDGQVYTPQAVIDGVVHVVGSDKGQVVSAEASALKRQNVLSVALRLTSANGSVHIDVPAGQGSAGLWVLRVARERSVAIGRGENAGNSVIYTNVVRGILKIGDWNGQAQGFDFKEPQDKDSDGYVVLLQAANGGRPGAIYGAVKSAGM